MRKYVTSAILGAMIFVGGTCASAGETAWMTEDDVSLGWMQPRMSLEQVQEVYGPMKRSGTAMPVRDATHRPGQRWRLLPVTVFRSSQM